MLRKIRQQRGTVSHAEIGELKTGSHRTAHQGKRPILCYPGCEPGIGPNDMLMDLAAQEIRPQPCAPQLSIVLKLQHIQRLTGVEVPHFIGLDFVKCRKIALFKEKVNTGTRAFVSHDTVIGAADTNKLGTAIGFHKETTFRMGLHPQSINIGFCSK